MVDLERLKACDREEISTTPLHKPLPVDDYFMTIAILSQELGNDKNKVGACIVSNESLHIVSIGYKTEKYHAELHALMNAKKSQVDLTTCSLYTTNYPCAHCIMAILRCGIRVVVHGGEKDKSTKGMVNHAKACFKYIYVDFCTKIPFLFL
jgi:deoxycytidylate deaminase